MTINHQLSDSASPAELATHAKIVEAGRKAFSGLAINSGSSSLRFTLFKTGESLAPILTGKFERIGLPDATLSFTDVRYPNIAQDADGMQRLFKQFSFPGGIPSHVAPETPASIHEGGELGYSLSHAFGDCGQQTTHAAMARHGRRQNISPPASAAGRGPATIKAARRMSSWRAAAPCLPSKPWPQ